MEEVERIQPKSMLYHVPRNTEEATRLEEVVDLCISLTKM